MQTLRFLAILAVTVLAAGCERSDVFSSANSESQNPDRVEITVDRAGTRLCYADRPRNAGGTWKADRPP